MTLDAYLRAAEPVLREFDDVELTCAEGEVPAELRGVLYRNGPGTNASFGVPYAHPFDGDGHVVRFAFEEGRVRYRNRFVRTRERVREAEAARPLYRSFGTNLPGGLRRNVMRLRFKNAANTSVVHHAGRLLALWEGGLPHRLDPQTLATVAREDFEGGLHNQGSLLERVLAPELPFSAHPKLDPETGDLHNFGTLLGRKPRLMLYRISARGDFDTPVALPLERLVFLHDFALTPRYRIFFLVPVAFRVAEALSGKLAPAEALEALEGIPTTILLVPRDGGTPLTIEASPCFLFHFAGAHDERDGRVVVVGMRMPTFPSAKVTRELFEGRAVDFPSAVPFRYLIDPKTRTVVETQLSDAPAELPTTDIVRAGTSLQQFWSIAGPSRATDPFLKHVQKFDLASGLSVTRDFSPDLPGEPLFVRSAGGARGEGRRLVLTLVYRTREHRSDLYVLDADDLRTVCRLELPHHVPPGFHGTWLPHSPG